VLTFGDLIGKEALKAAAESDIAFRRRVPSSVGGGESGFADVAGQVGELVCRLGERIDVGGLLEVERVALLGAGGVSESGDLKAALLGRGEGARG
jgi:hypothetical protein